MLGEVVRQVVFRDDSALGNAGMVLVVELVGASHVESRCRWFYVEGMMSESKRDE